MTKLDWKKLSATAAVAMMGMSPVAQAQIFPAAPSLSADERIDGLKSTGGCSIPTDDTPRMIAVSYAGDPCAQAQVRKQMTPPPQAAPDPAQDGDDQPTPRPFGLKATLYITTNRDSGRDSIGCTVVPMRTVAVDGVVVKRHTVLFIAETVGLPMPDGSVHNGYWYATDVGSAIHAGRVDLYTGKGMATIKPLLHLNLKTLTVTAKGRFAGCPTPTGAPI